jgi:hypothetical protein
VTRDPRRAFARLTALAKRNEPQVTNVEAALASSHVDSQEILEVAKKDVALAMARVYEHTANRIASTIEYAEIESRSVDDRSFLDRPRDPVAPWREDLVPARSLHKAEHHRDTLIKMLGQCLESVRAQAKVYGKTGGSRPS